MSKNSAVSYRLLDPKALLLGGGDGDSLQNVIIDPLPNGSLVVVLDQEAVYRLAKFSLAAVSSPDVIATSKGAGVRGRWIKVAPSSAGGGAAFTAANATELPFSMPDTTAGIPTNMTLSFQDGLLGERFFVTVSAFVFNDSGGDRSYTAQISWTDESSTENLLVISNNRALADQQNDYVVLQSYLVLPATQSTFTFQGAFLANGAGVQVSGFCLIAAFREDPA